MASVNKVILIGNLGRDPETRYTTGGDAIANLNIATSEQWKDKNGEKQEKTEWHRVVLFGRQAEIAGEYLKKGRSVYIEGRLQTRKYTDKDGVEKYSTEIVGDRMQLLGSRDGGGGGDAEFGGGGGARSRAAAAGGGGSGGGGSGGKAGGVPSDPTPTTSTTIFRSSAGYRETVELTRRSTANVDALATACDGARDDTPAQADVAVVEHEILPRRRRPLRGVEDRAAAPVVP